MDPLNHGQYSDLGVIYKDIGVGSSAVRAPPVAAAAKMGFDAKIAVISTGYS